MLLDVVNSQACSSENVFPLLYGDGAAHVKLQAITSNTATNEITLGFETKYENPIRDEGTIVKIDRYGKVLWSKIINRGVGTYNTRILGVTDTGTITVFLEATSSQPVPVIVKFDSAGTLQSAFAYGSSNLIAGWDPKIGAAIAASSGRDIPILKTNSGGLSWTLIVDDYLTGNPPVLQTSTYVYILSNEPTGILLSKVNVNTQANSGLIEESAFYSTSSYTSSRLTVQESANQAWV